MLKKVKNHLKSYMKNIKIENLLKKIHVFYFNQFLTAKHKKKLLFA